MKDFNKIIIPANSQILVCPHCGSKKSITMFSSEPTTDVVWSDGYSETLMSLRPSVVQRCSSCGHYFMMSSAMTEISDMQSGNGNSRLSYREMKEAYAELSPTDLTDNDRLALLFHTLWAFNSEYRRQERKDVPATEKAFIKAIADGIISLDMCDDITKAELLRETGRFDEALAILRNVPDRLLRPDGYINKLVRACENQDSRIFVITAEP